MWHMGISLRAADVFNSRFITQIGFRQAFGFYYCDKCFFYNVVTNVLVAVV